MAPPFVNSLEMLETAPAEDREARLVRESLAGDTDAFTDLVRSEERQVFRLLARFFRRPEEVEEVAQETFLRVWRKLGTYRAEAPFGHWVGRIAMRSAYDRLRRKGIASEPLSEELEAETGTSPADPTARLEVERLLARLTPVDRFLLTLLEGEGWSIAEIAERLGWTQVNVKVRAHRARKRLRKILEEGGE
jgi:RNA polymerase sigma-70 factor, ECF subfamily